MKLAIRYGLWVSVAGVIVSVLLGGLTYHTLRNLMQERAVAAQLGTAHTILNEIDRALTYARRDMHILAEDEFLRRFVSRPEFRTNINQRLLQQEIRERSGLTGPWDDLMVVDRDGNYLFATVAHAGQDNIRHNPDGAAALRAVLGGEDYNSALLPSDHTGEPTMLFAVPIFRRSGGDEVVGAIISHYHWPAVTALLAKRMQEGSLFLFDAGGRVIAEYMSGTPVPGTQRQRLDLRRTGRWANGGAREAVYPDRYGGKAVVAAHVIQPQGNGSAIAGWGLLIEQAAERVYAPARKLALETALIVIGAMAAISIALTLLGYRLMRPLGWISDIARRIGRGDYRQHIEYKGQDEIGTLAESFNAMVDQLERNRNELIVARNRIQGIVDTVPGIFYSADPDNLHTTYVSPAVTQLLGYSVGEFLTEPTLRLDSVLNEDRPGMEQAIAAAREAASDFVITYRAHYRDGQMVCWFEDRGSWERDSAGRVVALHGVMTDITERRRREEQLARSRRALGILHAQDSLLTRAATEEELVQGACENLVGEQAYPFAWVGLLDEQRPSVLRIAARAGAEESFDRRYIDINDTECLSCRAINEGSPYLIQQLEARTAQAWPGGRLSQPCREMISLPLVVEGRAIGSLNLYSMQRGVFDEAECALLREVAGNLAYGIMALRTQVLHNEAREELTRQAYHDSLTGLPNRTMLIETLEMAMAHAERNGDVMAVLFIDLDDFKLVNDTLGHHVGDRLLCMVGERLRQSVRSSDMVARQGGDEFIVLMSGMRLQPGEEEDKRLFNPASQAQRLVEELKQPFRVEGQKTYVGASIGIAVYPHDARDAQTLLRNADSAMYRAKEIGRGTYSFYSAALTERQHRRVSLANRLHQALEKQQFQLYYQPVVELESRRLVGVEALIRWESPDSGLVSPDEFLPVAEDSGLILPIGEWVIEEACRQLQVWQQRDIPLRIAINISARQLWHGSIADKLMERLDGAGVESDRLELEITESAMSHDSNNMEAIFLRFHEEGLRISLDDFGTGYSSLSRLKHLPIHTLKIDKSFVDGVPRGEDDTVIVAATIQMADSLGLTTLAEGIEREEQWQWLKEQGCRYGQGYFFSPAVTADEVERLYYQGALGRES